MVCLPGRFGATRTSSPASRPPLASDLAVQNPRRAASAPISGSCEKSGLGARRQAHASDAGDVRRTARLVALLFLSTCRNYKVSNERIHRIAIEAKLLEDIVSQMNRVKHRRYCDIVRRLR